MWISNFFELYYISNFYELFELYVNFFELHNYDWDRQTDRQTDSALLDEISARRHNCTVSELGLATDRRIDRQTNRSQYLRGGMHAVHVRLTVAPEPTTPG